MGQQAHVSSMDALDTFRARLIVYVGQARSALEEVTSDVTRFRNWIENDQRTAWETELRKRARALDEARQALFSSRLSTFRGETSGEQMAVHRAQRSLAQAEEKLRIIKVWARDYDNRVQPLVKQVEKLHTVLTQDMAQAIAYLGSALQTLAAYADKSISVSPAGAALPAGDAEAKPAGDPHTAGGQA